MFLDEVDFVSIVLIQQEFDFNSIPPNFDFELVSVFVQSVPQSIIVNKPASKLAFATKLLVISYCASCYRSLLDFKTISKSLVLWANDSFIVHFVAGIGCCIVTTTFLTHCFDFFGVALLRFKN